MSNFKRVLCLLIAVLMLLATFTACGDGKADEKTESKTESGDKTSDGADSNESTVTESSAPENNDTSAPVTEEGTYTISLKSAGGLALSGIDVLVYEDNSLSDLVQFGQTNDEGVASLKITKDTKDMAITFTGLPEGYIVEEYYSFDGASTEVVVSSAPVSGKSLSETTMELGDVMYDFTVTDFNGETVTLSELLKEKDLVVLNFWYTTCSWCLEEFPVMNDVYSQYSDNVEILAINPLDGANAVKAFAQQYGYSFRMADCPAAWSNTFAVTGYPTSVFIDRYGVVCLIEAGAITTNRPFVSAFEHFTAENYTQKLCTSVGELVTEVKPNVEFEGSEVVAGAINKGDIEVTYRPETDDSAEYSWPFVATEKNGEKCVYATNAGYEDSFAILYADVTLKAGQAIGFDYIASSEKYSDILYVIVNDNDIYQISGNEETTEWKSCYPWVAEKDGVYELALCYLKDSDTNEGDDTVYIKNMRVIDADDIDVPTYIPRNAATLSDDGLTYSYVEIFFNESDNYYHVGSADGPLLLAELMGKNQLNDEKTIWDILYDGDVMVDGKSYYDTMVDYFSYASNSALNGVCTVNGELAEHLKVVSDAIGFDDDENEWLKACTYYQVYGTDGAQLVDPIEGVATFAAPEAVLGVNKEENVFYYDRAIMPRGMFKKFVPATSGAYRIVSHNESINGVDGWIFDGISKEPIYTYEGGERTFVEDGEVSMVYYMEAGKEYYINIAFWDIYEVGYIYFDIEYLGASYNLFEAASPGFFTYDSDATGTEMYYTISGGIKPILKDDGFYYHDLGLDANGNQLYGSMIYADFTGVTAIFDKPISNGYAYDENGNIIKDENGNPVVVEGMISLGGFDFSKTEDDLYILGYLELNGNDVDATREYLKKMWGDSYDDYAEGYKVDDVLAGIYHGKGEDFSDEISEYESKIIKDGSVKDGCVPVDEELAELLQLLMDKYTFEGVENSWLKVCYYYNYLG
ncbi:MAG: TlpA family protein disulfide reductase [Ruminococcaceae bacterium]|nr:TlpA family protein disulfide reductase [Oscillospiraceae bacterium]